MADTTTDRVKWQEQGRQTKRHPQKRKGEIGHRHRETNEQGNLKAGEQLAEYLLKTNMEEQLPE